MATSVFLLIIALILALVEWKTTHLKKGEPRWPRNVKLLAATMIFVFGVFDLYAGWFARYKGISLYRAHDRIKAIRELQKAEATLFCNREVLDTLALCHKQLADAAVDRTISEKYYEIAKDYCQRSIGIDAKRPTAKNALINIARRERDWRGVDSLLTTFIKQIDTEYFKYDSDPSEAKKERAKLWVTIGNVYADPDYPGYSCEEAIKYYRIALIQDPHNTYALENLPPRLVDLSNKSTSPKDQVSYLKEAFDLNNERKHTNDFEALAFCLLTDIEISLHPLGSTLYKDGLDLSRSVSELQSIRRKHPDIDDHLDVETWLLLAQSYIALNNRQEALKYLKISELHERKLNKFDKVKLNIIRSRLMN